MRFKHYFLFILFISVFTHLFSSDLVGSIQKLSEYQKRLNKINEEIETIRNEIQKEEQKEYSLLSSLDQIGLKQSMIKKQIASYNLQLEKANQDLISLKERTDKLRSSLENEKKAVKKVLISLYKYGNLNFFHFMLQAKDMKNIITESKNLSFLAKYQDTIISQYLDFLIKLQESEKELSEKTEEISNLIQKNKRKKNELDENEKKNRDLIKKINKNKDVYIKILNEKETRKEQLLRLVQRLQEEGDHLNIPLVPFYEKKGKLPWPIQGNIVSQFGREKHPQFNTVTMNKGIEISPEETSQVKSVHPGKVVFADYFQGYGYLVIIDHGMKSYSIYGRCSEIYVKKGEMVQAEQSIASIGDFHSIKGVSLHFEIRENTEAQNPLHWLKRR